MAITEVGNHQNASYSTAITDTHGLSIAADDVVVCLILHLDTASCSDNNGDYAFTGGIVDMYALGTVVHYSIYYRVAGASEPSTYAFTLTGGGDVNWAIQTRVFRGVDTSSPWNVLSHDNLHATGLTHSAEVAPSIETTRDGCLALAYFFHNTNALTWATIDNGFGADLERNAAYPSMGSYTKTIASAGEVGATTAGFNQLDCATSGGQAALQPPASTATSQTLKDTYNVRGLVSQTLKDTYNAAGLIDQTLQDTYDVHTLVSQTLKDTYDLAAPIGQTLRDTYGIAALVSQTLKDTYDLAGYVSQTLQDTYNVSALVSQTLQDTYNVSALVSQTYQDTYGIGGPIGQTVTDTYDILALVSQTLKDTYNVLVCVSQTLQDAYHVVNAGTISIERRTGAEGEWEEVHAGVWEDGDWTDTGPFVAGTTYYYRAQATIGGQTSGYSNVEEVNYLASGIVINAASTLTNHDLSLEVASTLSDTYNVATLVSQTLQDTYDVKASISQTYQDTYDLAALIAQTYRDTYNMGGLVAQTLTDTYGVGAFIGQTLQDTYNLRTLVGQTYRDTYDMEASYDLYVPVSQTYQDTYGILTLISQTYQDTYNMGGFVAQTLQDTYNITAPSTGMAAMARISTATMKVNIATMKER